MQMIFLAMGGNLTFRKALNANLRNPETLVSNTLIYGEEVDVLKSCAYVEDPDCGNEIGEVKHWAPAVNYAIFIPDGDNGGARIAKDSSKIVKSENANISMQFAIMTSSTVNAAKAAIDTPGALNEDA